MEDLIEPCIRVFPLISSPNLFKVNFRILFLLSELNLLYEVYAHCCLYRAMFIVFILFSGNLWVHGRLLTRGIYTIYTVNTHILHLPIYKHIFITSYLRKQLSVSVCHVFTVHLCVCPFVCSSCFQPTCLDVCLSICPFVTFSTLAKKKAYVAC